ncbi:MAG: hypothetical protein WCI21_03825 [Alphaproteobacteria bacterium]
MFLGAATTGYGDAQVLPGLQLLQQPAAPTPAQEAAQHGFAQCGAIIDKMTANSIGGPYAQSSMWHTQDTNKHVFQSVAGITLPSSPQDALAALISAPLPGNVCDGVAVQVIPLAVDCANAENLVKNGGGGLALMLRNTRVMLDANRDRLMLLPGASNTCIAVSVKSYFYGDP